MAIVKLSFLLLIPLVPGLQAKTVDIGSQRELFVDDYLIASMSGDARQKLHRPAAREVVLTTNAPWEGNTSAYYTVFRDGELFRMYYRGSHWDTKTRKATHREVTCYAESRDGIHWTKPALGQFEFAGSRANNIVLDGIGTHCFAAFRDDNPDCPAEARYKGISRGRPAGKKGLFLFHSPDGLRWSLTRKEPVITEGAFDSQNLAFWDAHRGHYREYHRTFVKGIRAIMTATSTDYVNWTKPTLLTYQEGLSPQHLYTNAVQTYPRAAHLLLGFPTRYLPDQGERVEPTLMVSRDGRRFHRWIEPVIPENAPRDRTGNRSNYMAWGLVELPGRPRHLSVYASEAYYTGPDSRLRRFEYRKDGFVSVHSSREGGTLLTKAFRFSGSRLYLNYRSAGDGHLRAELQTPGGQTIPGFSLSDCTLPPGDEIDKAVTWKKGPDLAKLQGTPVRLLVELRKADLFALRFAP